MTTAALAEPVVLTDARMAAVTAGQLDYAPGLTNVLAPNRYSSNAVRAAGVFGEEIPPPVLPRGIALVFPQQAPE